MHIDISSVKNIFLVKDENWIGCQQKNKINKNTKYKLKKKIGNAKN